MKYHIYSREHNSWWRPNSMGYTINPKEAGEYTLEEAQKICKGANEYSDEIQEFFYPVVRIFNFDTGVIPDKKFEETSLEEFLEGKFKTTAERLKEIEEKLEKILPQNDTDDPFSTAEEMNC